MRNHDHHPSFAILRRIDTVLASLDTVSPGRARRSVNAIFDTVLADPEFYGHGAVAAATIEGHRQALETAADWIIARRG